MSNSLENQFIELIEKNVRIIHKVIGLYIDTKEESQDMLQEILLQAWKSYSSFREDSKFSTWLYKIALNTVLNYNKKKKFELSSISFINADNIAASDDTPPKHEILYYIIKKLDEIDKSIITLHLDSYKNMEIAEILGISINHVNVKIHRIKARITKEFKSSNYGHTTGVE